MMDNPLYHSEPFNRTHAWIDLLLLANSNDNFFYKRGIRVNIQRGQIGHDTDTLAKRWKWSRGKVERYLTMLESDGMIVRQKSNVTTLISICKYDDYQANDKANSKANDKANGQQTAKQTDTNKNDKNYKNEKNVEIYRQILHLQITRAEVDKLIADGYTIDQIDNILDRAENWKGIANKRSLYLTAKNWLSADIKKITAEVYRTPKENFLT
jgi:predicted transcriptional regulator